MGIIKGIFAIISTIMLWSLAVVLIKYLSYFFDVATQNFIRYSTASFFLLVLSLNKLKNLRELFSDKHILIPASFLFLFQTFTVHGLYITKSTIASLLMRTSAIFTILLSYSFFKEERKIIKSKMFILGSIIAFLGVFGIYYEPFSLRNEKEIIGMLLVILGSFMWSCYIISIKKLIKGKDPLIFTIPILASTSIMFIPHVILFGNILDIVKSSFTVNLILVISGILGVGLGNWMNYIAIKELGAVIPAILRLLIPLFTGIFSYIILNEVLTLNEIVFGTFLLFGCGIVMYYTTKSFTS